MTPAAQPDPGPIHAPGQFALTLPPGQRLPGRPRMTWKPWSADEQLAIEMNDTIGGYSRGRFVVEA